MNDPAATQIARERIIFPSPVSQTYSEGSKVTTLSPCFFYFAWVSCNTVACVSCISTHFPWYFLGGGEKEGPCYTFSSFFYFEKDIEGGGWDVCHPVYLSSFTIGKKIDSVKLKSPYNFPVFFFFLVYLWFKHPSLLSIFFFLLLVSTL